MKFRVGQRVRKARRGPNVGYEGVVVGLARGCYTRSDGRISDVQVRYDRGWVNENGYPFPANIAAHGVSEDYEPIQDRPELSTWDAIRALGLDVHAVAEAVA